MKKTFEQYPTTIYLVQLGALYYVGSVKDIAQITGYNSFEFTENEHVAKPFIANRVEAEKVAKQCGGSVTERQLPFQEAQKQKTRHEAYRLYDSQDELLYVKETD